MRKSFTLIELMVSIMGVIIIFEFIFKLTQNTKFQTDSLKNDIYITMDSFRAMELMSKKLITLNSEIESNINIFKFNSRSGVEVTFKIENENLIVDNYKFKDLIFRNLIINKILSNNNQLYKIYFEVDDNGKYKTFTRIVYVK